MYADSNVYTKVSRFYLSYLELNKESLYLMVIIIKGLRKLDTGGDQIYRIYTLWREGKRAPGSINMSKICYDDERVTARRAVGW